MKQYFSTIWVLSKTLTKRWFRDPVALFFTFMFPLIFLLIFGAMSRSSSVSFNITVVNNSDTKFASQFAEQIEKNKVFEVKDVQSFDDAKEKMGRGELDSIIELPKGFGETSQQGVPSGSV